MTVGFYSPWPPVPTGVADYAAALLPAMQRYGAVMRDAPQADIRLYHLGNNQLHREAYTRALAEPGVAVLHDAVLNHFYIGCMDRQTYVDEFVFNYGEWARDLACELWRDRSRCACDHRYFDYPMLRRVATISRALIVHNPKAARTVRTHAPSARVYEIPHLWQPEAPLADEVHRARELLGFGPGAFVLGVFGYLRESKRLSSVLRAFDRVRHMARNLAREPALLVAGSFVSEQLKHALAPALGGPGIRYVGHTDSARFLTLAAAADACINLRHPSAGETSGITIRLMGLGKPVVLTDAQEVEDLPEGTCVRVKPDAAEVRTLADYMRWLCEFPEDARELGRRARRHIQAHHHVDSVARRYWEVLVEEFQRSTWGGLSGGSRLFWALHV